MGPQKGKALVARTPTRSTPPIYRNSHARKLQDGRQPSSIEAKGAKRSHKHKDSTNHDFWNPPLLGLGARLQEPSLQARPLSCLIESGMEGGLPLHSRRWAECPCYQQQHLACQAVFHLTRRRSEVGIPSSQRPGQAFPQQRVLPEHQDSGLQEAGAELELVNLVADYEQATRNLLEYIYIYLCKSTKAGG